MKRTFYKQRRFLKRNASTILTVVGALGVVATFVTAVTATPKAMQILEDKKQEKGEKLNLVEVVKYAGPSYIPSLAISSLTIACMFESNVLNKRHQAALVSAYSVLNNSYKTYKTKLKELYGNEAHEKIVEAIVIERAEEMHIDAPSLIRSTNLLPEGVRGPKLLFYEPFSGRYFETTMPAIMDAEYSLNRNYVLRGEAPLSEWYRFLGIEFSEDDDVVGWSIESGIYWLDFNHREITMEDGRKCYVVENVWEPEPIDFEYYY